ncbi:MAG: class I SAM-dependent methyltransferase [Pyrinomonadaceae bacterium]
MPTSFHHHITKMMDWVVRLQPRTILDIGVGFGKWGFLCREYLDIFNGRYKREEWQTRIEGVEAFRAYATPTYDYAYDQIHYGDVREILPTLSGYDLIIIGDVIEHFEKPVGLELLAEMKRKSSFVLLSSPTEFYPQGDAFENEFERHLSFWNIEDFAGGRFDYEEYDNAFVALIRGELPTAMEPRLDGAAAKAVYSRAFIKRRQRLARLMKNSVRRWYK